MKLIFSPQFISRWCIYIVLVLVNIAYCPGIILTPNYKIVMALIMGAIIISLSLTIYKEWHFALSLYLYYGTYALLISSIAFIFSGIFIFQASQNIYIAISCFLLGYCVTNQSEDFIYKCMKLYVLAALFLGLYSVYINLGSFIIADTYAFSVKNSSGVLLGTAIIINAFILLKANNISNKLLKIIWSIALILLIICLLTFRCRTAIVSVTLALLFLLYRLKAVKQIIQRPLFMLVITIAMVLVFYLDIIPIDFIYNSLFSNKNINNLDSITSGRLSTYDIGLDIFSRSPIFGNAALGYKLPPIDNFIIVNLTYYGIIGALLVFPPYVYVWYKCLRGLFNNNPSNLYPFLTLFIICMSSFTEGPYPFGPGTPVMCAWFLVGYWTKNNRYYV